MSKSNGKHAFTVPCRRVGETVGGEASEIKTAQQAYEICAEIVKEAEKNEQV